MSFVIFDTEYTTWLGCQENGWTGNQKKEVVQIAALKVSDELKVIDEFNVLCQPTINPVLSEYFIKLTHITNERIKKHGESFVSAYKNFEVFVEDNVCYSHSWGADFLDEADGIIMKENILLNKVSQPKKIIYRNIAPLFVKLYQKNNIKIKNQCSGQIAKLLGLEENLKRLNLDTHNAFYDTYSILEGLKFFFPESIKILKKMK